MRKERLHEAAASMQAALDQLHHDSAVHEGPQVGMVGAAELSMSMQPTVGHLTGGSLPACINGGVCASGRGECTPGLSRARGRGLEPSNRRMARLARPATEPLR